MKYTVSRSLVIEATSPEAAAREADRLDHTTRPREYAVTSARAGTVFIEVTAAGDTKRIA